MFRVAGAANDVPRISLLQSSSDWCVAHRLATDHSLHPVDEVCQHCLVPRVPSIRDDEIVGYIVGTLRVIVLLRAINEVAALQCKRTSACGFKSLHQLAIAGIANRG